MTATAHVAIGAGLGGLIRDPAKAFIAGVISHHFADSVNHKEAPPSLDGPMAVGILLFLRIRYGRRSPQYWGALGAIIPDLEHVLREIGLLKTNRRFFTSHRPGAHGKPTEEFGTQILAAFLGGLLAESPKKR